MDLWQTPAIAGVRRNPRREWCHFGRQFAHATPCWTGFLVLATRVANCGGADSGRRASSRYRASFHHTGNLDFIGALAYRKPADRCAAAV